MEKELNERFKTTVSIVRLGGKVGIPMPSLSTGLLMVDNYVIQTGGIPEGRIIEVFGPESAGKTTICLQLIAQAQRRGGIAALVDAEHAIDPNHAHSLGVNVDELLLSQPDSGEQALETVEALVDSKCVDLIIVDSVAALVPQAELDGEMGDSHMGLQARLMSQAMRKLRGKCSTNKVTVVFINQIREKIGVMYGNPETTPGGRALKFYASVRLDIRRREEIKSGSALIGHQIKVKAVKNKVGVPLRETLVDLIYGQGFDTNKDFIEYAIFTGVIKKNGAWYGFGEKTNYRKEDFFEEPLKSQVVAKFEEYQKAQREQ